MENNKGKNSPEYSVDDILAEAKDRLSSKAFETLSGEDEKSAPRIQPPETQPKPEQPAPPERGPEIPAPISQPPQEMPAQPMTPGQNGEIRFISATNTISPEESEKEQPAPRGLKGFFARRRIRKAEKACEFDDEEDIYYGLQLKPVEEYKKGYDDPIHTEKGPTPAFRYLFDETPEDEMEEEISARFQPKEPDSPVHLVRETQQRPLGPTAPQKPAKQEAVHPELESEPAKKESTQEFRLPELPTSNHLRLEPLPFPKESESGFMDLEEAARLVQKSQGEASTPVKQQVKPQRPAREVLTAQPSISKKEVTKEMDVVTPESEPQPAPSERNGQSGAQSPAHEPLNPNADSPSAPSPVPQEPTKQLAAQPAVPPLGSPAEQPEPVEMQTVMSQSEEEKRARAALEQLQAQAAIRKAEQQKKEQIRSLVRSSRKYLPNTLPVHILEFNRLEAALARVEECYQLAPEEEPEVPAHKQPRHRRKKVTSSSNVHSFHFLGEMEEDNDPGDEPVPEPEPENLDDYTTPEDAPSILHELGAEHRALALRVSVTGILLMVMLFWGFVSERSGMLPTFLRADVLPLAYLITNLCLFTIAVIFCRKTVFGGIRALARLQANADSGVAVAAVAAWIQGAVMLFQTHEVENGQLHLYAVLAGLGLFLNSAGKLSMVRRIRANFRFLASPEPKMAVELFDDYNTALQLAKGCVVGEPLIAYQRKTGFFRNYLRNSYDPDPSEQASQSMAPLLFLGSILLCAVSLIFTRSASAAVTAFAAAACVSAPITSMLCANMPISRLCALARRCGTMLVGNSAVEYFCNTNALMTDSKELFPKGTVILNGIKTFGGQRIDEVIMDASAVMCKLGGPLSDLFEQIIQNRRDILPKAENITYEDDRGVTGWVNGRRTLVGTRQLLEQHGLTPPSRDYENKYLLGGKKVVYLASQGELVAMFVISYNSDKRRAQELRRMEKNGISLILRTTDPNMTPEFVAECFGLDPHSVRVLPEALGSLYQNKITKDCERSDALLVTKGRPASMMRMLTACVREKSNVTMATMLQTVGVILGFLFVAFLIFFSGLEQLSTMALLLYQLFWTAAVLLIPRLRKP